MSGPRKRSAIREAMRLYVAHQVRPAIDQLPDKLCRIAALRELAQRVDRSCFPQIRINRVHSLQRMSQKTAIENHNVGHFRLGITQMMARYGTNLGVLPQEIRQIAGVHGRIRRGPVERGELTGKLPFQYGFQRTAAIFEDVVMHHDKSGGSSSENHFDTHKSDCLIGPPRHIREANSLREDCL